MAASFFTSLTRVSILMLVEGEALLVHRGLEVGLLASKLNRNSAVGVDISVGMIGKVICCKNLD